MGVTSKRKMMMKTILTILTAVAVVLGAPQYYNNNYPYQQEYSNKTEVVPSKYRQGPPLVDDKVRSSVEKRSAIDFVEEKARENVLALYITEDRLKDSFEEIEDMKLELEPEQRIWINSG